MSLHLFSHASRYKTVIWQTFQGLEAAYPQKCDYESHILSWM